MWFMRGVFKCDWHLRRFRASVRRALSLNDRYEARSDGLVLETVTGHLNICWRARDVHPWDFDDPPQLRERLFFRQLMEDTEAALLRLFKAFPEIDRIDLRVLDLHSDRLMASGSVQRASLRPSMEDNPSVRMRLAGLGIECHFSPELALITPICDQQHDLRYE